MHRRRGFTLIELLVVIAIIGILAAMLFPVFARARESARKVQCLANVKNLAIAVNMYLTDFDKLLPNEHGSEARDWLVNDWTVCNTTCDSFLTCRGTAANPYLRAPVILDDYCKNRDIWKCPSAFYTGGSVTVNPGVNGDWVQYMKAHSATHSSPCPQPRPCTNVFPHGWAGNATDTVVQGWNGGCGTIGEPGVFVQNYAFNPNAREIPTSQMNDPAKYVVIFESGANVESDRTSQAAYTDMCRIDHVLCADNKDCGGDWYNCSQSRECSPLALDHGATQAQAAEAAGSVQYRKDHYHARHLGGANLGFADGHAKWMPSETILMSGENWSGYGDNSDLIQGLGVCFNPTAGPQK